jgi:hypothetical protein
VTPLATVVNALEVHGCRPRERMGSYVAHCPAHDDALPSLRISEGMDHRALVKCWAGCTTARVVEALGLTMGDLFDNPANPMEAYNR